MTVRFLLSSTNTVHTDGCPTMAHIVDGKAPRISWSWERTLTPLPTPDVLLADDEHLEPAYVVKDSESQRSHWEDLTVTLEQLAARTASYSRCAVCAPDVPAFAPRIRMSFKRAGNIDARDIGRRSVDGVIASVHHISRIRFEDGTGIEIDSDTAIEFYPRKHQSAGDNE